MTSLSTLLTTRLGPTWPRDTLLLLTLTLTITQSPYITSLLTRLRSLFPPRKPTPPPALFRASTSQNDRTPHLLLCATGSVATIKIPQILTHLATAHGPSHSLKIILLLTPSAAKFLQNQSPEQPSLPTLISSLPEDARTCIQGVFTDADEWAKPWVRGDPILHIELRRWADLMLIAPLSADSLSRIGSGRASDLISSVVRAWDTSGEIDVEREGVRWPYEEGEGGKRKKGIVVAPAMNTAMWEHPVTREMVGRLEGEWGVGNGGWVEVLRPVEKGLACGDTGSGAMREWGEIVGVVEERLGLKKKKIKSEGESVV